MASMVGNISSFCRAVNGWSGGFVRLGMNRKLDYGAILELFGREAPRKTRARMKETLMRTTLGMLCLSIVASSTACSLLDRDKIVVDPAAIRDIPAFVVPVVKPGVAYERFIVIGDMGSGHADQAEVASAMAAKAGADGLDFWLTTGDNIYPNGVQSVDDGQWNEKFERIYAAAALQKPIYPSLGNHDYKGSVTAQIDYAQSNPLWKMPATYYTFTRTLADGAEVQFFAIDTEPMQHNHPGTKEQLAWLDQELGKSGARWKIVYGHHPLYGHNPNRGYNPVLIGHLDPIFAKHGVDVYFAGHDHALEMIKPINGVHHVISGAGGGADWAYNVNWTDESFYVATLGGFVYCRVSNTELVIEFVRMGGETQYAHVLRK
jgi:hypothetical protein